MTNRPLIVLLLAALAAAPAGCGHKPAAEVSEKELAQTRTSYGKLVPGTSKQKVLDSFPAGNKVKLGTAVVNGASIEEWKVEAYRDVKNGKDMFVTFLYFLNDKLVDSSDTRINFRENATLVERWQGGSGK